MGRIGLVAFDVDGVLVPIKSSWEYLHEVFGTRKESRKYTELYRSGKISYYEWMYLDTYEWIARFNGKLPKRVIVTELEKIPINEEFKAVFTYVREIGAKSAMISGGINILVERVARHFNADFWFSNVLLFDDNDYLIPGGMPVVPADKKGEVLRGLANQLGLRKEEVVYIGDSPWDESAFKEAGLSIIYGEEKEYPACIHAKNAVDVLKALESYNNGSYVCGD
jgi:phosphoserine phosphatase